MKVNIVHNLDQFIYSFENIQTKDNFKYFQNYEDKCYISLRDTYFEEKVKL